VPAFLGLRRLQQAVEEALRHGAGERERHAFFTSIGHELRTPLTAIRGYLETLLDEELDPETARRFLETAQGEAARMGRLVDGLHELALLLDNEARGGEGEGEGDLLGGALPPRSTPSCRRRADAGRSSPNCRGKGAASCFRRIG
jgi:signal transduction histidine kinase